MILIDLLQDYCKRIYHTEEEIYDLSTKVADGISYPSLSKSEKEIRELIVILTSNNIWTVEDLKRALNSNK